VNARDDLGRTPLHEAAHLGKPENIVTLLERGAELQARDKDGLTPLHWAARGPKPSNIVALLDARADGSARDDHGHTPFDLIEEIDELRGTDAYRRLDDAQYE
jgi:ankyrin repeat protein